MAGVFFTRCRGMGTAFLRLNTPDFLDIHVPLPPPPEQTAIAEFLDRETGKIDELVAEQRRLMELLKEKRQAVISHAVTRGLDPAAPLKPSGIEWLGDVPAHWKVTPIKYVAKVGNGSTPSREVPEYWDESGFPWLNSSVVNQSVVTEAEGFVTERALKECHLPIILPPAVLVGITGQGRTRGMAAMLGMKATINQHVAYVKPSTAKFDVHYLLRSFEMAYLKLRRDSEEAGATKGAITCEQLGNLRVPFPPFAEQQAIVAHLNAELAKFDTLTAEAQRAIDLLQERRTALISAAVTGQIDVRADDPDDFAIVLRLPPVAAKPPLLEDRINGVPEMKRFWVSGDPADLPENPDVVVVMDWLNRMAEIGGFERPLEHLGLTHQDVVDQVLQPAENGKLKPLRAAHPLVLMQCLWRIGVQYERCGYDDMRRPILSEKPAAAGELWRELRQKLIRGQERPCLMFATAGR